MPRQGLSLGCALTVGSLLLFPASASPQGSSGRLVGTVRDGTAAVLPGATITLVNEQTNSSSTAISNSVGGFTFPQVQPVSFRTEGRSVQPAEQAQLLPGRHGRQQHDVRPVDVGEHRVADRSAVRASGLLRRRRPQGSRLRAYGEPTAHDCMRRGITSVTRRSQRPASTSPGEAASSGRLHLRRSARPLVQRPPHLADTP